MVLISVHLRKGSSLLFNLAKAFKFDREQSGIIFSSSLERPAFFQAQAACSELPSNISTMIALLFTEKVASSIYLSAQPCFTLIVNVTYIVHMNIFVLKLLPNSDSLYTWTKLLEHTVVCLHWLIVESSGCSTCWTKTRIRTQLPSSISTIMPSSSGPCRSWASATRPGST